MHTHIHTHNDQLVQNTTNSRFNWLDVTTYRSTTHQIETHQVQIGTTEKKRWIINTLSNHLEFDCTFKADCNASKPLQYNFYGQFQSHDPQSDYLIGTPVEEEIKMLRWCTRQNGALTLLATNGNPSRQQARWKSHHASHNHQPDPYFELLGTKAIPSATLICVISTVKCFGCTFQNFKISVWPLS